MSRIPPHNAVMREIWHELRVVGDFDVAMRNPVIRQIISRTAARRNSLLRPAPPRGVPVKHWQDD
ncbi:hypothetical protein [Robbsia andropogonis]|uniref:hypothetical protein n=1 Tax=Robbsia andropogonis TaxID=28092 RepID=UPI00209D416E|nr:hypothetical protein [Robbsia andropogonis]MCP1116918.1 hypothetical protein [Robbsia andropogonis]MCP1126403.1 hypothetical protein [Robbsia andropogonis]